MIKCWEHSPAPVLPSDPLAAYQPEPPPPLLLQKVHTDHPAHSAARNPDFLLRQEGTPDRESARTLSHQGNLSPKLQTLKVRRWVWRMEEACLVSWVRWRRQVGLHIQGNTLDYSPRGWQRVSPHTKRSKQTKNVGGTSVSHTLHSLSGRSDTLCLGDVQDRSLQPVDVCFLSCSAPCSVRHTARTHMPCRSSCLASRYLKLESQPLMKTNLSSQ